MDVGLRLTGMMNAGLDVKWNFLRSSTLDLAIDPRIDWLFVAIDNRDRAVLAHLPVMVGINVAEPVTLLVTGGISGGAGGDARLVQNMGESTTTGRTTVQRLFARAGAGVQLRFTDSFALQPELTVLVSPARDPDARPATFVSAGMGFVVGAVGAPYGAAPAAASIPTPP
jgi:hypothetical protein